MESGHIPGPWWSGRGGGFPQGATKDVRPKATDLYRVMAYVVASGRCRVTSSVTTNSVTDHTMIEITGNAYWTDGMIPKGDVLYEWMFMLPGFHGMRLGRVYMKRAKEFCCQI